MKRFLTLFLSFSLLLGIVGQAFAAPASAVPEGIKESQNELSSPTTSELFPTLDFWLEYWRRPIKDQQFDVFSTGGLKR